MSWEERLVERDADSIGAIALDREFTIIGVSDGVLSEARFDRADLLGRSAMDVVHPDDLERAFEVLAELVTIPGDRAEGMYRLLQADGTYRQFALQATNLGEAEDNVLLFRFRHPSAEVETLAFADDAVHVMWLLSESLSLEESFHRIAKVGERHVDGLQLVVTMLGIGDGEDNKVFSRGDVPHEVLEVNFAARPDSLPPHVKAAFADFAQGHWRSARRVASLDHDMPGRLTSVLVGRSGEIVGFVEALRDTELPPRDTEWLVYGMISRMITAALHRFEVERQLRRAANIDDLTGLMNRRRLFEALGEQISLEDSLLFLIDLDRFSWVNNTLGHQTGDEALIAIARALEAVCPQDALIARLGGDEFVVWVPAQSATSDLTGLGDRITEAMVVPVGSPDRRLSIRGSIGMVKIAGGEDIAAALNRADQAMYRSKRQGGDRASVG